MVFSLPNKIITWLRYRYLLPRSIEMHEEVGDVIIQTEKENFKEIAAKFLSMKKSDMQRSMYLQKFTQDKEGSAYSCISSGEISSHVVL